MRGRLRWLLTWAALAPWSGARADEGRGELEASRLADDQALVDLVWTRSPEVLAARGVAESARAEVVRAGLFPNPELNVQAASLPLAGVPDEIGAPWTHGPSLTVGLGWTIEVEKRAPRRAYASAQVETARAQAIALAQERFFDLLTVLGRLAFAELEADAHQRLVAQSEALLSLQRTRLAAGDIAQTEVAKAELEHERILAQQGTSLSTREEALGRCGELLGILCPTFGPAAARAWVDQALGFSLPETLTPELAERHPELFTLEREARQAKALSAIARAASTPDIGLGASYTFDTFPGNIGHTAAFGVTIPLPVASRGQAEAAQARYDLARIATQREARVQTASRAIEVARRRLELAKRRTRGIDDTLARAQRLVDTLTAALQRGAGNLGDILLARRSQQEIELDRLATESLALDAVLDARRSAGLAPSPSNPPSPR